MQDNAQHNKYYLLVLPIFYGVICLLFLSQLKYFYATITEPSYAYLANSLNLAIGHLDTGMVEHPGLTVQWLGALVLFFIHLVYGKELLYEDVLSNPEMYIYSCATVLAVLLIFSVYKSGILVFKYTGNIIHSLFFQLLPVCAYTAIHHFIQLRPESVLIIILNYYCAYLWVLFYLRTNNPESDFAKKEHLLFFSLATALLITTKISTLPFLLLPFLLIRNYFSKIKYIALTFVFSTLIIFPIWPKLPMMFQWIYNMVTHSGTYGHGTEDVINFNAFKYNLSKILTKEHFFTVGYVFITIGVIAGAFKRKEKRRRFYELGMVLWLIISINIILVAKHFNYYYLIPAQLLIIPAVGALNFIRIQKTGGVIILTVCVCWLCYRTIQSATVFKNGYPVFETIKHKEKYAGLPKIITTSWQNTCFVESILRYGISYSGSSQNKYYYFLRKKFPDTYFCGANEYTLLRWDLKVGLDEIAEKHSRALIYFHNWEDSNIEKTIFNKLSEGNEHLIQSITLDYENKESGEKFYLMTFNADQIKNEYSQKTEITCDMENVKDARFISSIDTIRFIGAEPAYITSEKFNSGKSAVKLTPVGQYSCSRYFSAHPGDLFEIEVLCESPDRPCAIVLDANAVNFYTSSESVIEELDNGWKRIKLRTKIPANFTANEVKFYLFYPGKKTCYVDDLHISYFKK